MSLRIEANYIALQGGAGLEATPRTPQNPYESWTRVHEYTVGTGYTFNMLLILYVGEPNLPLAQIAATSMGWVRVKARTSTTTNVYNTIFECDARISAFAAKQYTPRLVILPCGDGIRLRAGQGVLLENCKATTTITFRHWANFWGNSDRST